MKDLNEPTQNNLETETERERKLTQTEIEIRVKEDSDSLQFANDYSDDRENRLEEERQRVLEIKQREEAQRRLFYQD